MSVTGVEMYYGYYMLKPAPLITVGREMYKQRNGSVLGGGYRVTLNGSLLPETIEGTGLTSAEKENIPSENPTAAGHQFDGNPDALTLLRAKNDFLYAFNRDRELFRAKFLGSGPLCSGTGIYGAPRVVSVEFSSDDNWTKKVDYTVELFFNNSMSTGTGVNYLPQGQWAHPSAPLTGIIYGQSGAYDYIAGDLESYSREYSVETLSKGAQFGSGYLPTFLKVNVNTSAQVMEGQLRNKGGYASQGPGSQNPTPSVLDDPMSWAGAQYSGVRTTIDPMAGTDGYQYLLTDTVPPITFDSQSVVAEVVSGYIGTALSGLKGVHTESNYNYSELDGNYNYNDSFVVYGTIGNLRVSGFNLPNYPVMDTPSIDIEGSLESAIVTVTLQGELQGFAPFYGDRIGKGVGVGPGGAQKESGLGPYESGIVMGESLANAQRYLDEAAYYGGGTNGRQTGTLQQAINQEFGLFYNRASNAYSGLNFPAVRLLPLQPEPISQSISYNTREATIGYTFSYNNRPPNCFTGALHEKIDINRGNPADVYANLTILGRPLGPILQDIGTIGASTTEVSIEAVIVPDGTGSGFCTGDIFVGAGSDTRIVNTDVWARDFYSGVLDSVEIGIKDIYGTSFVTSDSESYDPKTGRYTRSKAWIHALC